METQELNISTLDFNTIIAETVKKVWKMIEISCPEGVGANLLMRSTALCFSFFLSVYESCSFEYCNIVIAEKKSIKDAFNFGFRFIFLKPSTNSE